MSFSDPDSFGVSRVLPPQNFLAWGTQDRKFFKKNRLFFFKTSNLCRTVGPKSHDDDARTSTGCGGGVSLS